MKKIISILLMITMMFASLLAVIPAAAEDTEVINLLPDGAYDAIKQEFYEDGASTANYVPSVTPFAFTNSAVNKRIAGSKLLSIKIPVKKTLTADENGDFIFTLTIVKSNGLMGSDPVDTKSIKINAETYGLTENTENIHKFIEVDLSSYDIRVAEDEVLAFAGADDTLLPGWAQGSASDVQKKINELCPDFVGFAANVGKSKYSVNNNSCIFFDLALEKNIGWDDEEDRDSLTDEDFEFFETRRFMPEDVYAGIKELYEKDGAGTSDWVPSVAPFTPVNTLFQDRFEGTRLRSISLPVNKTGNKDSDGNFVFTISTYDRDNLTNSTPINSWKIKINAEEYGLTENTSKIYRFIENIDLTSYDIIVGYDEVLAFSKNGDTFIPGYSGGAVSYFQTNFPEMMGFGAYTGTPQFSTNTWTSNVIFFDITYDVPATESYVELKAILDETADYAEEDFASGWKAFAAARDAAVAAIEEGGAYNFYEDELAALVAARATLAPLANRDKTALAAAIESAAAYAGKDDLYTEATWNAFAEALENAKAVNDDENAKQSEINKATEDLTAAIAALDEKGDVSTLQAKIDEATSKYVREVYTAVSYKALSDAIRNAEEVVALGSVGKSVIDAAAKAIDDAITGLKKVADFTAMNELVAKYENATEADYHPDSLVALTKAIEAIKDASKPAKAMNVSEEQGAALLKALEDAIAGLKEYADYTAIDAKLAEIEALVESEYTPESWKAITDAKAAINALKNDRNSINDDAVAALEALNAAVDGLVKVSDVNNTDAPADTDKTDDTSKKGCGSVVGVGAVALVAVMTLGCAVVFKKKD